MTWYLKVTKGIRYVRMQPRGIRMKDLSCALGRSALCVTITVNVNGSTRNNYVKRNSTC